ncbi:hypothetical protein ATANTOWER_005698 [Ataeniobius toweri]|uniref:Uncharacterized protein n=1 Tax=Ataeniobius toweri TaxID=208326 RepID=A0ABU7BJ78_9TELE|nr:hypothetical protein [Ataeniobius toweri]
MLFSEQRGEAEGRRLQAAWVDRSLTGSSAEKAERRGGAVSQWRGRSDAKANGACAQTPLHYDRDSLSPSPHSCVA